VAKSNPASELAKMINDLRRQRSELVSRIGNIDQTFIDLGIPMEAEEVAAPAKKRGPKPKAAKKAAKASKKRGPGRPKGSKASKKKVAKKVSKKKVSKKKVTKKASKRTRGNFGRTGEESVLAFVKKLGEPTAGDVNRLWKEEGRGGAANNTLGKLVTEGKLVRNSIEGKRGGTYKLA